MNFRHILYILNTVVLFAACTNKADTKTLFSLLPAKQTGIHFENKIVDTAQFNILDYLYYYNGGGVAIGDINNDGLADIYFSSNQGSNKLYLNKGNFQFEDITDKAGVAGSGNWKTGVTMADVNGDGLLDIYVSEVGGYKSLKGRNELFINKGDLSFSEQAADYGLAIEGFNTQAVFFDYDKDDDLDVFIVNHSVHSSESYGDSSMRSIKNASSGDKLLRNDEVGAGRKFIEVTTEAGIYSSVIGYGLNAAVGDLNNDGWDDIYVSNDFHENDYYYLNNGNGSFSEINREAFGHESRFSMGSDIADVNNDGWLDIVTLDMLPTDEQLLKTAAGDDALDIYNFKFSFGYYHQYSRNCLQLNTGAGKKFSEIGLYAGIAATDWSWAPLIADFDNDGIKDLFVTNGILRRPNDLDFLKFNSNRTAPDTDHAADIEAILKMPIGKVSNTIYKGTDSIKFSDQTISWGFDKPSFSNGAACADLDNDGDLDIVVNNINEPAFIYQNQTNQQSNNHYLEVQLEGDEQNRFGIGTKVVIQQAKGTQLSYLNTTKGFESSSLQYIHFGVGVDSIVEAIQVKWPDGKSQILNNVKADQRLSVSYKNATTNTSLLSAAKDSTGVVFENISARINLPFKHNENSFNDFDHQPLIPHQLSTRGPKLAVADVNGDGLEDFYIGGAKQQAGKLFIQTRESRFVSSNENLLKADSACEDVDALFFDADNDKDLDLYVVSGGNEYPNGSPELKDRLYINDGKGNFSKSNTVPEILTNKSCIAAADIDGDGDMDLFIGATSNENDFGTIPDSYLLINEGNAHFKLNSEEGLKNIGMITACAFGDFDNDKDRDLLVVGEWMAPMIFENEKGKFRLAADKFKGNQSGWWQSISLADINNDGAIDIIAGNYGLNSKLHASAESPLVLYVFDYDNNGTNEQILAYRKDGNYYPFLGKDELEKQIPSIKKKFLKYGDFAGKTIEQIFGDALSKAKQYKASNLASTVFVNDGRGNFSSSNTLPMLTQLAPVFSVYAEDFNKDGKPDLLTAGNFSGVLPYEGRYDALLPAYCKGDGRGNFISHLPVKKELQINGEIRDIKEINLANKTTCLIFARNNDAPVFLTWK